MKKLLVIGLGLLLAACQITQQSSQKPDEVEKQTKVSQVQMIEFFDFGCIHCRRAAEVLPKLEKEFGDRLNLVQKHFPLSKDTFRVAEASECARMQDKFREFHDDYFEYFFSDTSEDALQEVAARIGLDLKEFKTCVASSATKSQVKKDQDKAKKLGLRGTPFFMIESVQVPGMPGERALRKIIEKLLEE